jgi:sec-independent protein translocase protein TatC
MLLLCSNILVLIGWLMVYEMVLPKLAEMLLQFEVKTQLLTIQLEARIDCYIKWSSQLFLVMAIVCQLPIVSYLAFQLGFFEPKMLSQNRRVIFLFCLLLAALLSPPDLLAQWATTIFLFVFFEITIWLGMAFKQIAVCASNYAERSKEQSKTVGDYCVANDYGYQ